MTTSYAIYYPIQVLCFFKKIITSQINRLQLKEMNWQELNWHWKYNTLYRRWRQSYHCCEEQYLVQTCTTKHWTNDVHVQEQYNTKGQEICRRTEQQITKRGSIIVCGGSLVQSCMYKCTVLPKIKCKMVLYKRHCNDGGQFSHFNLIASCFCSLTCTCTCNCHR